MRMFWWNFFFEKKKLGPKKMIIIKKAVQFVLSELTNIIIDITNAYRHSYIKEIPLISVTIYTKPP